jgi:hypothetical protein
LGERTLDRVDSHTAEWLFWCRGLGLCPWLPAYQTQEENARILGAYAAHLAAKPNKEVTIQAKLWGVAKAHMAMGIYVDHLHAHVREVRRGILREQGERGQNVKQQRRPMTPAILLAGLALSQLWQGKKDRGGVMQWFGLATGYVCLLRAEELWAQDSGEGRGRVRPRRGILRQQLEFRLESRELPAERWREATHVAVHLLAHKGDQFGRGSIRARGGVCAEIVKGLFGVFAGQLPPEAPLCAVPVQRVPGRWFEIGAAEATETLREMLGMLKLQGQLDGEPHEYALHSGRIGGAVAEQRAGASDAQLREGGGWHSNAHQAYERVNRDDNTLSEMVWPESVALPTLPVSAFPVAERAVSAGPW